jgi:CheY-like chemotaxis protein
MTPLAHNDPLLLIADDDLEMRAMLREVLTEGGFRIAEAATSDELVGLAPRVEPAAIILDHHLPGARGLDVLPILKRCCPDVPVVLITAFGGPRTRDTALKLGVAAYLNKPFRAGTLLDAIGYALGRRGTHGTRVRQPSAPGADGPSRPLRGLTILLVEDDAATRHTLSDLLRLDGARVLSAEDGLRALEVLARGKPHVMVSDLQMPRMDGFELIRRLRADPRRGRLFVVALTGLAGHEDRQRIRRAGFDAHLTKPVDYLELRRYLCLGGHRARRTGTPRGESSGHSRGAPDRRRCA